MKQILCVFTLFTISITSNAQLEKRTYLVGGTGSFSRTQTNFETNGNSQKSKSIDINISPAVGYFFIDKLAAGLRTGFSKYKVFENAAIGGAYTNINRLEFGPFARYYFLPKDKQLNIIADAGYQYGIYSFKNINQKGNINTFSFFAGPVVYFNNTVGLEFLIGYKSRTEDVKQSFKQTENSFQIAIGFQFHLKK